MREFLHDDKARALTEHEATASDVEGFHGVRRIVTIHGHHARLAKSSPHEWLNGSLGTAGDHDVRLAVAEHGERVAHHIIPARAAAAERDGVALDAQFHREFAATATAVSIHHRKKADSTVAAFFPRFGGTRGCVERADCCAFDNTHAVRLKCSDI